jgi:5'-phosphate synthase pdxT subunit
VVKVGVLALQGDYAAHAAILRGLGVTAIEVRRPGELTGISGVILPGGESTALLNLMSGAPWFDALRALHGRGAAVFGTCAGAILLARRVAPGQPSLGLLDATVERNAYGRQASSFEAAVETEDGPIAALFIRAPRIRDIGSSVRIVGRLGDEVVAVRDGNILAATFHPELTASDVLHRQFLELAA